MKVNAASVSLARSSVNALLGVVHRLRVLALVLVVAERRAERAQRALAQADGDEADPFGLPHERQQERDPTTQPLGEIRHLSGEIGNQRRFAPFENPRDQRRLLGPRLPGVNPQRLEGEA